MEYSSGSLVLFLMLIALAVGLYIKQRNERHDRMIIEKHCPPQLIHIILSQNLHLNRELWEKSLPSFLQLYTLDVVENAFSAAGINIAYFFDKETNRNFIVKYRNGTIRSWVTEEERTNVATASKTPQ